MPTDYKAIFEGLPSAYLILSPDFTIIAASDAYLKATNSKRQDILNRNVFEAFPDNPNDPNATGVTNLTRSLKDVLKTKQTHIMGIQRHDIPAKGGGYEEKWWRPHNTPFIDKDGKVVYIAHFIEDVTQVLDIIEDTINKIARGHTSPSRKKKGNKKDLL